MKMTSVKELIESHPHWPAVKAIYHSLQAAGYKAFLAGGCVRDALLGLPANDLDVATDATPEQIEGLFERTINVGKVFGVMRVLIAGADIEVATFRQDGEYLDGRRPEGVIFSSPEEDAKRRDFTVNALFFDLETANILDFVGGQKDLEKRILRTVGTAERRFAEDHLRLLRAARFVAQLDFHLESESMKALKAMASEVRTVSGERLRDEMFKLLKSASVAQGLEVMESSGLMQALFPFRMRKNVWSEIPQGLEAWQYFALFSRHTSAEELKQFFHLLKLSNREKKNIENAWALWRDPESFFHMGLGKKLISMAKEGTPWVLEFIDGVDKEQKIEIRNLQTAWKNLGEILPRPYLTGEDIGTRLSGKAIGDCLEKSYQLQLEKKHADREMALEWLQDYLKGKS